MGFGAPAGGITKLSELEIDAAPGKAKNIAELILTTQGDMLYRNTEAERVAGEYGVGMNFLHLLNTGKLVPGWRDLQGDIVYITGAVNRVIYPAILSIPTPSIGVAVAEDHSGGGHVAEKTLGIPVPSVDKAAAATSVNACGGAVAHDEDNPPDSDETAEANSVAINDMTLLQPDGAIPDWYALGYANLFDAICLLVGTVGVDVTLDTFEYSKGGGAWGTLTVLMSQLNDYETAGKVWFTFERPAGWAVDTYAGIANMYWIKLKSSVTGAGYVQPKGTQAWILVY
ncbi:hypothetical protein ES704_02787 [subsurface metagenome]|jgi:hypothetical protein